jgi:hydrogenase-4 component B
MQYTGGSFSAIAADWFSWIFRLERIQRRPRGPFPERASRIERVPETVLEQIIEPAGDAVMQISNAARRLQHGRLQFYIVYLACGLIALATLALWTK